MTEQTAAVVVVPEHLKQLFGETPEAYRDRILLQWQATQAALTAAKDAEMELRKVATAINFPAPKEGTQRVELGKGYALKYVNDVTYSFTAGLTRDQIGQVEDACAKLGNEGAFLADRLFVWKCEPSKSEYKKLDANNPTHAAVKKLFDTILVTKSGAPKLEIEEPKVKRA